MSNEFQTPPGVSAGEGDRPTSGTSPLDRVIHWQLQVMAAQLRLIEEARGKTRGSAVSLPPDFSVMARSISKASNLAAPIAALDGSVLQPEELGDVVPFTDAQMEVWLGATMQAEDRCMFNEVAALDLRGVIDRAAMDRAVSDLVERHESLRMAVSAEPLGLRLVGKPWPRLVFDDISSQPEERRHEASDQLLLDANAKPFDLTGGPLVQFTLIKLAPDHHRFVIAAHHLVCDGWSFAILLRDLSALYSAYVRQRKPDLKPAPKARAFARQVLARKHSPEARQTEAFWLSQFASLPDPLELPTDRPRPPVRTSRGSRVAVAFDSQLLRRLKAFAAARNTTLFSTTLSAFEALVFRLTGQDDLVVGIPIAGQASLGEDLVAHCVNFVPFRFQVDHTKSFSELLSALQQHWFDVEEHQDFTYGSLLAKLAVRRALDRNPLVSVSFTFEPAIAGLAFDGLRAEIMTVPRVTSKRDLHLDVMETEAGLLVEADFSSDLFNASTVQQWLRSYGRLLDAAISEPNSQVSQLPILVEADRLKLETWNDTARTFADSRLIHQLVESFAVLTPDRLAVRCEDERLTWAEVNRSANQLAHALVARQVGRGDRVAVCLERSASFIVSLLAIHKAGAAYVPLDPSYPSKRLAVVLADADARVVVTSSALIETLPTEGVSLVCLDSDAREIARQPARNLAVRVDAADPAYVMYTSGTTGQPKGVVVEHRQLLNYTWAVIERLQQHERASYALVSTVAADLGNTSIFPALATGGTLHVITPERAADGRLLGEYFEQHQVDVMKITPTHLDTLIKTNPSRSVLPRRCLVLGGESALPGWVAELQRLAPDCTILNHYGPTETTVGALTFRVEGDAATLGGSGLPLGKPLGNVTAHILDAEGQLAPIGVAGELYLGGEGVARGYLNREDLTAQRFVCDPFAPSPDARMYRTGDRARWRPDGNLEFLGRNDNQVKVRGYRVELGEIESALRSNPNVREAVVLLRQDDPAAPQLVAYVSGPQVDVNDLRAVAKQLLPPHATPSAFVVMQDWPLTPNGKLDRRALPAPSEQDRVVLRSVSASPASPLERRLEGMWQQVLGVSRVGMGDDFFLLGGHSLAAMRLLGLVHRDFGVALHIGALLKYPIFGDLARHLESKMEMAETNDAREADEPSTTAATRPAVSEIRRTPAVAPTNVLVRIAEGGTGAPFFWVHGVGGEVFSYMALSRHLATSRPVYGFTADWSGVKGHENPTLEVMARHYATVLRTEHPDGPYHIGGFCSAAMLALELARQLEADGGTVGVLAVIDYDNTPANAPQGFGALVAFLKNLPRWLKDDAMASGFKDFVGRVASRLRRLAKRVPSAGSQGPNQTVDFRDQIGMWRFPAHQVAMLKTHHHAIHTYQPKPFKGRVSLFLPRTHPLFGPWPTGDDRAWSDLAGGGVSVHEVRGSHSTMLTEPFASELAATLMQSLRKAEAAYASDEESRRQSRGQGVSKVHDLRLKSATTRV